MKNLITPSYIFTPGASGVGTLDTNITNFDIRLLIAVVNITREEIIYAPALSGRGYTNINGDTITLEYNTTGQASTDILHFFYDSTPDYPSIVNSPRPNDLLAMMQRLVKVMESLQVVDSAQRQRISIDTIAAGTTLPTVTTVGTVSSITAGTITTVGSVTNVAAMAGMDREQYINISRQTAALALRPRLTFQ